jgi:hypothetical protein
MKSSNIKFIIAAIAVTAFSTGYAQGVTGFKQMSIGDFHNFYAAEGCVWEVARNLGQQDGWRWPAIYPYQDMQAARAMWVIAKNFDALSPYKGAHVGPRVNGAGEVFPTVFKTVSKYEPPQAFVDGQVTYLEFVENDEVDPDLDCDRMIVNEVNTIIGLTIKQKIRAWQHPDHDDYHIREYTFINTGNTDFDDEIEIQGKTLEDVVVGFHYRWSVCKEIRYVIGNDAGWGYNTMNDFRLADYSVPNAPDLAGIDVANEQYRTTFAWHGYWGNAQAPDWFPNYDNIGAPIMTGASSYTSEADTNGRLGAAKMPGVVTIHADKAPDDQTDDIQQPITQTHYNSDGALTQGNSHVDIPKTEKEYAQVTSGYTRHALKIDSDGDFTDQTNDPSLGDAGGQSAVTGYGPWTLAPGDSITIVVAEGAAGLDWETTISAGLDYKNGVIDNAQKNALVLSSLDSLLQLWDRAIANYQSDYALPYDPALKAPLPPKVVEVNGGGDNIQINWEPYDDADPATVYRVYRGISRDSVFRPIHTSAGGGSGSYQDRDLVRGISYYYYVAAVGANGVESSRYFTQTFLPATLKTPPGPPLTEEAVRVVPNPYIISSDPQYLRFGQDRPDQIGFFNLPRECDITIYTEIGEKIAEIEHTDGSGVHYWNTETESGQVLVSGVYIAVVQDDDGNKQVLKFVVIR